MNEPPHEPQTTDERERQLEEASELVVEGLDDDPSMSGVIDPALGHLIQSAKSSTTLMTN